jgi:hypothetical protein
MRKQKIGVQGHAYQQGDVIEVYLKLANGKYVRCVGSFKEAKRRFGRFTPVGEGRVDLDGMRAEVRAGML